MRIHKAFGHYIDLDPVVAISDIFFTSIKDVHQIGNDLMIWSGVGRHVNPAHNRDHRVRVCQLHFLLREGHFELTASWPNSDRFLADPKRGRMTPAEKDHYERTQVETFSYIQSEYRALLRAWEENRPQIREN